MKLQGIANIYGILRIVSSLLVPETVFMICSSQFFAIQWLSMTCTLCIISMPLALYIVQYVASTVRNKGGEVVLKLGVYWGQGNLQLPFYFLPYLLFITIMCKYIDIKFQYVHYNSTLKQHPSTLSCTVIVELCNYKKINNKMCLLPENMIIY